MHVRNSPISGLYAIGNAAARTETGSGYQTGFSLASAITFGLIAARDMSRTKRARHAEHNGIGISSEPQP
jgi:3-oxosteroid 1-dehydrogenase